MATWAVVGAGRFASARMVPAIARSPGSVIAGVWSRDSAAADRLAVAVNGRRYESVSAVADDPRVDVVYVAATAASHPSLVLPLLHGGKAVLCEKPVATSVEAAQEIATLAALSGAVCFVNHHLRANDCIRSLKSVIDRGDLGTLRSLTLTNHQVLPLPAGWRLDDPSSGGVIRDLTIHDIDLSQHLLGPLKVESASVTDTRGAVETSVSVNLLAGCGAAVVLSDGWIQSPYEEPWSVLVVNGENGHAEVRPAVTATASVLYLTTNAGQRVVRQVTDAYERVATFAAKGARGESVPLATINDALSTLRLIEEVRASST